MPVGWRSLYALFWFLPVRLARNFLFHQKWDDLLKWIALLVFGGGVVWAEFAFFDRFWELLARVPFGFERVLPNAFSYMGSFLFGFLVYSSLLTSLTALYRSYDFPLLLKAPIRVNYLLVVKWFDVAVRSAITLIGLALPPMISLALTLELGWPFFLAYLGALLSIASLAVSFGMVLAMLLMFFFPVRRLHQTLSILGLCLAAILITGMRFLHLETLWSANPLQNPLIQMLQEEPAGWAQYAPGAWFAQSIRPYWTGQGSSWSLWGVMAIGFGSFIAVTAGGGGLFLTGWWKGQEQGDPETGSGEGSVYQRVRIQNRMLAMMIKDWLILKRDPSIWTQLFMMIPLVGLYLLNLAFLPAQLQQFQRVFTVGNVALIALLVAVIGARFIFPTFSREGRTVWAPMNAPLSPGVLLTQKALFVLPPVFVIGALLLTGSGWILQAPFSLYVWSLAMGGWFVLQISLLALFLGFCFPLLRYRHLMEVSLGKGAFLYMALCVLEIGGWAYYALRGVFQNANDTLPWFDTPLLLWMGLWLAITFAFGIWGYWKTRTFEWVS